jgi:hypothetical protein
MSDDGQGTAIGDVLTWDGTQRVWSPAGAASCPPLSRALYVDGGTSTPLGLQDGGICTPFATISQALAAVGAGFEWVIWVVPGTYVEDLTIPAQKGIAIRAMNRSNLTGSVSWANAGPGVGLLLMELISISGTVTITDGGFTPLTDFTFQGPQTIIGKVDGTGHLGGFLSLKFISGTGGVLGDVGEVDAPTAELHVLDRNRFAGTVSVGSYAKIIGATFKDSITVATGPSPSFIASGFYRCAFGPGGFTYTSPGVFRVDGVTEYNFEKDSWVFAGGAVYDRIDDPMLRSVDADLTVTNPFPVDIPNRIIFVTALVPGGPNDVVLPASPRRDDFVEVKDVTGGAAADNIDILGNGNTIDGVASKLIAADYASLSFRFNGTEWSVV